ncbi:MAG: type II CAAX endopeptidase family protein [Rikenellaceae bacterium]
MIKNKLTDSKYPNLMDIIMFLGLYFILATTVGIVTALLEKTYADVQGIRDILSASSYIVVFVIMLLMAGAHRNIKLSNPKPVRVIRKFKRASPFYVLFGILAVISITFVVNPFVSLFSESLGTMYDYMGRMGTYMMLTCVIAAPLLEEMLFRGIVQSDFERRYGAFRSIVIASLIFSVIHINPAQIIYVFFVSIVLGIVYFKTKSLWTVILIHSFNNALSILLFNICKDRAQFISPYADYFENNTIYHIVYSVASIIVIFTMYKLLTIENGNKENSPKIDTSNQEINLEDEQKEDKI